MEYHSKKGKDHRDCTFFVKGIIRKKRKKELQKDEPGFAEAYQV